MKRPPWDEYFLGILPAIAARASCDRGRSAAIIVDSDNNIISTGYVGAPSGLPDCYEAGHDLRVYDSSVHCVRTIHAELNAILNAAKKGVPCKGATLYCTMVPCHNCSKAIIQCGIKRVVAISDYQRSEYAKENFTRVGVALDIVVMEVKKY